MNHIMIDLETLGTKHGSLVLSIAAVRFDLGTGIIGDIIKIDIDIEDSLRNHFSISADTYLWWLNQNKEAQQKVIKGQKSAVGVYTAIKRLNQFVAAEKKECFVWGNSARFDLGILEALYSKFNENLPWKHNKELDVRTLVFLNPALKSETVFVGVRHDPISDCKHQIRYCCAIYKSLHID